MTDPGDPGSSYTVLRIKRKATEPPLSSLVIENAVSHFRNKKRKDDAKSRGIFRLADTVPDTWQGQGSEGDVLRRRIKGLLETRHEKSESAQAQHDGVATSDVENRPQAGPSRPPAPTQYRVVPSSNSKAPSGLPPRVLTNEELNAAALKLLDAEAVSSSGASSAAPVADPEEEKEMAAFLPMLQEYLKLEGKSSLEPPHSPQADQYVYDLYYRDLRPSLSSTPLGMGLSDGISVGALLGYQEDELDSEPEESEPEDEADEDSNDEDYYRNDYPEDEDADEDMRGYKDAFGGEGESESEQGSPEDRNRSLWSYR